MRITKEDVVLAVLMAIVVALIAFLVVIYIHSMDEAYDTFEQRCQRLEGHVKMMQTTNGGVTYLCIDRDGRIIE